METDTTLFVLSMASLVITAISIVVSWQWHTSAMMISRKAVLRLGHVPTTVVTDGAVAVDALVRRAAAFSDRPAGGGATSIISGGRLHNINTVPYGPLWSALSRNLTSESFHPARGLAVASPRHAARGDGSRRRLSDGEMVGLVSEYLGAATGTVVAQLEWALANLRHMGRDVSLLGGTNVARGRVVSFAIEEIGRDNKVWTSPEEFLPERFMAGGKGAGMRLAIGSKQETTKVKMMPFGAGRRTCPGMGYAILHLEYFLANLVTTFEWSRIPGEEVDLTADYGSITTMKYPHRALVAPLSATTVGVVNT
uniref:Cytochrome P450 n=1 Tax=Leersia perrieri TaxID=77586 RepID=A0A0D9XLF9_9ORYZ